MQLWDASIKATLVYDAAVQCLLVIVFGHWMLIRKYRNLSILKFFYYCFIATYFCYPYTYYYLYFIYIFISITFSHSVMQMKYEFPKKLQLQFKKELQFKSYSFIYNLQLPNQVFQKSRLYGMKIGIEIHRQMINSCVITIAFFMLIKLYKFYFLIITCDK